MENNMPPQEKSYENGVKDTLLQTISNDVSDIKESLKEHTKWQQGVIESLAAGNEKFRQIEDNCKDNRTEIRKLKDRDRNVGVLSVIGNIIAAAFGSIVNKP